MELVVRHPPPTMARDASPLPHEDLKSAPLLFTEGAVVAFHPGIECRFRRSEALLVRRQCRQHGRLRNRRLIWKSRRKLTLQFGVPRKPAQKLRRVGRQFIGRMQGDPRLRFERRLAAIPIKTRRAGQVVEMRRIASERRAVPAARFRQSVAVAVLRLMTAGARTIPITRQPNIRKIEPRPAPACAPRDR